MFDLVSVGKITLRVRYVSRWVLSVMNRNDTTYRPKSSYPLPPPPIQTVRSPMDTKIHTQIRSDMWEVLETRENLGIDCLGVCVGAMKTIITDPQLRGKPRLDVLIHEFTHAYFQDIEEDVVDTFATQLSELLWSLGYRKNKSKSKAESL